MSSIINLGDQVISFRYKEPAKARDFNSLFRDIFPKGIYEGGVLSVKTTTTITIPTYSAIIQTDTTDGAAKVTTGLDYDFTIFTGAPPADGDYVIYGLLTWAETPNNYVGYYFRTVASGPVTNELKFGTITISGGNITSASSANRDIGLFSNVGHTLDNIISTQNWTYSETVGTGTTNYPQYILYTNGTDIIRLNCTWTSTTAQTYNPSVIVYELSQDSGTTYATITTKTYSYTSDRLTGISWS